MKTIYFVRHGEIPSNLTRRYAGWSDEGLTQNGINQARKVASKLKHYGIGAVFSSPLRRAYQTAKIIGKELQLRPQIEPYLVELKMGHWEGKYEEAISEYYPEEWHVWNTRPKHLRLPGRETLDQLLDRVLLSVERIEDALDDHEAAVAVTHVSIIRILWLCMQRKDLNSYKTIEVPNGSIFDFRLGESLDSLRRKRRMRLPGNLRGSFERSRSGRKARM